MIFWRNACIAWALFVALAAQAANVGAASVALPVLVPQRVAPDQLQTFSKLIDLKPHTMITGHGPPSRNPVADFALTRDYLIFIRQSMGKAVEDFVAFDKAYAKTDWSRFAKVPAFEAASRINAYGTYLLMEKESLSKKYTRAMEVRTTL